MNRAWLVWLVGVFAYVSAVLHRTSFGVASLQAAERYDVEPSVLSTFVVLQVVVYAGMQIPAGLLLDRFGSRFMLTVGGLLMASGQFVLAISESVGPAVLGRVLVGSGDAFTFLAALRLVPAWFPPRRVPLLMQLTGILGQIGQVLSAIPLLAILGWAGWEPAFLSAAAVGLLSMMLALAIVRDSPHPTEPRQPGEGWRELPRQIRIVWGRSGTRLGFFSHMGTQFSITTFALMWGVPYLVSGQGLSLGTAGLLLTISVVAAIVAGPVIGMITARYPLRRSSVVLTSICASMGMWTIVLALPQPAPLWLLIVLVIVITVGGPGSVIGFDIARTSNPSTSMGTAQGMVNIGGFSACLVIIQGMGLVLDATGLGFTGFRLGWMLQYPFWLLAIVGILISRSTARREQGLELEPLPRVFARRLSRGERSDGGNHRGERSDGGKHRGERSDGGNHRGERSDGNNP